MFHIDRVFEDHDSGYRQELKYFISISEAARLGERLRAVMKRDPHSDQFFRYLITSVYFDDLFDHSLLSSDAGLPYRKKYRIRAYNRDDSFIVLEKKEKRLNRSRKTSLRITREDYDRIIKGDPEPLKKYRSELASDFYYDMKFGGYRPKTLVEYEREVYVHPLSNVRITLDRNVKGSVLGLDIFGSPALSGTLSPCGVLLEVKYDHILPEFIASLLPKDVMPRTANCKYALGRTFI